MRKKFLYFLCLGTLILSGCGKHDIDELKLENKNNDSVTTSVESSDLTDTEMEMVLSDATEEMDKITGESTEERIEESTEENIEESTEEITEEQSIDAYNEAYTKLLMDEEYNILRYSRNGQRYLNEYINNREDVAFVDITGDGIPELFCICLEQLKTGANILNIYTYESETVRKIYSNNMDDGIGMGMGSCYFLGKDGNVYYVSKQSSWSTCFSYYLLSYESGTVVEEQILKCNTYPVVTEDFVTDHMEYEYYGENEEKISESEYMKKYERIWSGADTILFNINCSEEEIKAYNINTDGGVDWTAGITYLTGEYAYDNSILPIDKPISLTRYKDDEIVINPDGTFVGGRVAYNEILSNKLTKKDMKVNIYSFTKYCGRIADVERLSENIYSFKISYIENNPGEGFRYDFDAIEEVDSPGGYTEYEPIDEYVVKEDDTYYLFLEGTSRSEIPSMYLEKMSDEAFIEGSRLKPYVFINVEADIMYDDYKYKSESNIIVDEATN